MEGPPSTFSCPPEDSLPKRTDLPTLEVLIQEIDTGLSSQKNGAKWAAIKSDHLTEKGRKKWRSVRKLYRFCEFVKYRCKRQFGLSPYSNESNDVCQQLVQKTRLKQYVNTIGAERWNNILDDSIILIYDNHAVIALVRICELIGPYKNTDSNGLLPAPPYEVPEKYRDLTRKGLVKTGANDNNVKRWLKTLLNTGWIRRTARGVYNFTDRGERKIRDFFYGNGKNKSTEILRSARRNYGRHIPNLIFYGKKKAIKTPYGTFAQVPHTPTMEKTITLTQSTTPFQDFTSGQLAKRIPPVLLRSPELKNHDYTKDIVFSFRDTPVTTRLWKRERIFDYLKANASKVKIEWMRFQERSNLVRQRMRVKWEAALAAEAVEHAAADRELRKLGFCGGWTPEDTLAEEQENEARSRIPLTVSPPSVILTRQEKTDGCIRTGPQRKIRAVYPVCYRKYFCRNL